MKRFTAAQEGFLVQLARRAIAEKFPAVGRGTLSTDSVTLSQPPDDPQLLVPAAVFVTLKHAGRLRGCIGTLEAVGPLWQGVCDNARNAAFHDSRFAPLTFAELAEIDIEISVLSVPQPLTWKDPEELAGKLRPGIDGVILRSGRRGATFLPQVWGQIPDPEQFLGQLCRKAGLTEDAWRRPEVQIFIYQVESCREGKDD